MATFNTHFNDQTSIDVHRVPLDEVKRLEHLGKTRFLNNYPPEGKCLRAVEIRFGSILINIYTNTDEFEEMTDEPECAN